MTTDEKYHKMIKAYKITYPTNNKLPEEHLLIWFGGKRFESYNWPAKPYEDLGQFCAHSTYCGDFETDSWWNHEIELQEVCRQVIAGKHENKLIYCNFPICFSCQEPSDKFFTIIKKSMEEDEGTTITLCKKCFNRDAGEDWFFSYLK